MNERSTGLGERQFIAGLDRFDKKRDNGHGRGHPVLPENIGKVHAIVNIPALSSDLYTEAQFCESPFEYKKALCGRTVKVVLPKVFDPEDPDVCPGCADASYVNVRPGVPAAD